MRQVGILVCGCGVYDGTDVHEAVLAAVALEERNLRAVFVAPTGDQADVVDHATASADEGAAPRSMLSEAARLARGPVRPIDEILPGELDALFIPGGIGVVRNLCTSDSGPLGGGSLRPEVEALLAELETRRAPVAALGLASVVLRRRAGVELDTELLALGSDQVLREDGGRVLIAAGFLGTRSMPEVSATIRLLVDELAQRLGAAPLLRVASAPGKTR